MALTRDQKAEIAGLRERGYSIARIASATGHSPTTVWRVLKNPSAGPSSSRDLRMIAAPVSCKSQTMTEMLLWLTQLKAWQQYLHESPEGNGHELEMLEERINHLMDHFQRCKTCADVEDFRRETLRIGEDITHSITSRRANR